MANIVYIATSLMVISPTKITALIGCMIFQTQKVPTSASLSLWTELTLWLWDVIH